MLNVPLSNQVASAMSYSTADSPSPGPLSLYSEYQRMDIELRQPDTMQNSHWHGQVEVNLPFDDDVTYLINGEKVTIKKGHITLFWACVPHQLIDTGHCQRMAIFNLPMHLFLSWPLHKNLISHVTHGMVICSRIEQQLTEHEVARWQADLAQQHPEFRQLAISEIALMLKRFDLLGWNSLLINKTPKTHPHALSKHSLFYVSQILEYIAAHHDQSLTIEQIAEHVKLNGNYAMGIFQRVMQLTIKQYITAMRINHAKVLLSDSNHSIYDIALTVGFNASSRFYDTFQKVVGITPNKYRKQMQAYLSDKVPAIMESV
ncbi:transcriptional regulator MelR [Orbus mooreae]